MQKFMNQYKWPFVVFLAVFLVAGRALYADLRAGYYAPVGQPGIQQTVPESFSTDSNYSAGQYPQFDPDLAAGEGKETLELYCSTCHSPRYVTMQPPLSADAWTAEVEKMRKTFGASIPDEDAKKIAQYLGAHYTVDTRKR